MPDSSESELMTRPVIGVYRVVEGLPGHAARPNRAATPRVVTTSAVVAWVRFTRAALRAFGRPFNRTGPGSGASSGDEPLDRAGGHGSGHHFGVGKQGLVQVDVRADAGHDELVE